MGQELEDLPLFPLNTVLFPFANLRLHVFEDRYREMVRLCLREDRPFGVVLIRAGNEVGGADPYLVGTAARIVQVDTFDDGSMDIQIQGERRFRIRELDESNAYLIGKVEPLVEHQLEPGSRAEELLTQAREEFEALIQRLFARQEFHVQVVFPPDPVALSFTIANLLQMEDLDKQRMLETTDTLERVEDLLPILRRHILDARDPGLPLRFEGLNGTSYYKLAKVDLEEWITPN